MDAQIRLSVGCREGRSYIRSLYTTPPFRVVSVGQCERDGAAYLMQMSTSPGVLSGDRYEIDIELETDARLQFKSQSYQRIFDMEGEAQQRMRITVGDGAHYSQVSHPIVPHRNSSYSAVTEVELGRESSFLQSEVITCGRRLHGEAFEFREFSNSVEVYDEHRLRLKDRVWLSPKALPLTDLGLLEGRTHQATLIYQTTVNGVDIKAVIEAVQTMLSAVEGLEFGISESHYSGFVVRLLGGGGELLFEALSSVQRYLWSADWKR
ncbi:MAG: urease accessory protein UreD [Rikenellaceae bacterium]